MLWELNWVIEFDHVRLDVLLVEELTLNLSDFEINNGSTLIFDEHELLSLAYLTLYFPALTNLFALELNFYSNFEN